MNNKHAACFVIGAFACLLAYGTLVMKRKLDALEEQSAAADAAYGTALQLRQIEHGKLLKRQAETEGLRAFLAAWEPSFAQVDSPDKADRIFDSRVKLGGILALNKSSEPTELKKDSAIAQAIRSTVVFEDDYRKSLAWLSEFESGVPASRIASCVISKGQRGDDIKVELAIEFPLLTSALPATVAP